MNHNKQDVQLIITVFKTENTVWEVNLYAERIFDNALGETSGGIKFNDIEINNIWYVDDSLIIVRNAHELQCMINRVLEYSEGRLLTINSTKTKNYHIL